jgi:hypothetical protein
MRRVLLCALLLVLLPSLSSAAGKNRNQNIMSAVEVAVSAPVSVTKTSPSNSTGYLIVKTENETSAASLVVTVLNAHRSGDILVCTLTAITTNTTYVALLGSSLTAADGIDEACIFPMARDVKYTFTVTGGGSDFDVTADVLWVTD